jgi:hypothetical protein
LVVSEDVSFQLISIEHNGMSFIKITQISN